MAVVGLLDAGSIEEKDGTRPSVPTVGSAACPQQHGLVKLMTRKDDLSYTLCLSIPALPGPSPRSPDYLPDTEGGGGRNKYYPALLPYINCPAVPAPKENVLFSHVTGECRGQATNRLCVGGTAIGQRQCWHLQSVMGASRLYKS